MGDYSWTESLGTLLFVFGGGVTVGWLIVSQYMKDDLHAIAQDDQDIREGTEDYERSYYSEFEALEEKDHGEDFLKGLGSEWTIENTPYGEVIMSYKTDHEAFWYYAERRNVPYRTLDAVARRFAIDNDCKSVCVNYKEEFEKGKDAAVAAKAAAKEAAGKGTAPGGSARRNDKKKPFATFKSYNMKKGKDQAKKYIITENANRFTYKGMPVEWQDPQDLPWLGGDAPRLTYADFKEGRSAKVEEAEAPESSGSEDKTSSVEYIPSPRNASVLADALAFIQDTKSKND
tara:strand:- start:571 stop:1434 length:864 start_codon:yes stop_codon:yes gene_type:complete